MRIGIDIDGVIIDIEKWQLDYGSKYYFEKYGNVEIKDPCGFDTIDIFNYEKKDDDEFWDKHLEYYSINEKPRPFASEVIKKLKDDGNEIFIITARYSHEQEKMRNIVKNWLEQNKIYYDKIIFSYEDKLQYCIDNKIDIMIEDRPKNINDISKYIPVICYDAGYNEKCTGKNIIRAYSWYDIYCKIKKLGVFK